MDEILKYFIEEPEKEYHIREIAKITKKSPSTISKYLEKFEKEGLLISRKKFNHLLYKSNTENLLFKNIKLSYNLKKLNESGLIDFLVDNFNNPEAIILFGSFSKAENFQGSDIDILIITPKKKEIDLSTFEKNLNHKIQLFLHSNKEINKIKTKNKELLNSFINGIVLYGFWELFK
ncbi:MAG: ArsR family transcriptional regulator [Nanoarchaeota archaeon]|nr:ArsR family transcriptional regulator [Nanoarchaeota archaeon]